MNVSPKQLKKFKQLCEKRGIKLDDETARDHALRLMNLVAITRRSLPSTESTLSYER